MYIKKLTIKNFRVFDEDGITLQFNKGVNAIIGENNSGKSAVMDRIDEIHTPQIIYPSVLLRQLRTAD